MTNPTPPVGASHGYRDGTLANPNLTPEAVAYYNEQARRLEQRKRRRPLWKTVLWSGLLSLIPLGGLFIATVYVYTQDEPDRFNAPRALLAGWSALFSLVILVGLAIGVLWLAGGAMGFVEDGRINDIGNTLNELLRRR